MVLVSRDVQSQAHLAASRPILVSAPVRLLVLHQGAVCILIAGRLRHEGVRLDRLVLVHNLVVVLVAHGSSADGPGGFLHLWNLALDGIVLDCRTDFNLATTGHARRPLCHPLSKRDHVLRVLASHGGLVLLLQLSLDSRLGFELVKLRFVVGWNWHGYPFGPRLSPSELGRAISAPAITLAHTQHLATPLRPCAT